MTSVEYVNIKQKEALKFKDAWNLTTNDIDKDKIYEVLDKELPNYDKDLLDSVITSDNHQQALEDFATSLFNDIKLFTENKYVKLYSVTGLGFIRRGTIEAGCISVDDFGKPFDNKGYSILINIGLYYAANILVKSIIIENFQNDLEKYKSNGDYLLNSALKIYLKHDDTVIESMKFNEFPVEIRNDLNIIQSNNSVRLLQFVALHEFGHIVNGDLGIMNLYHDSLVNKQIETDNVIYQKEYKADIFALEHILKKDKNPLSMWGSFYTISYFFIWVWGLEKILKRKISNIHPNPIDRVWNLYNYMLKHIKDEHNYKELINQAIERIDKWTKNYNLS